ncbi:branched-chain amino acid ABC transporter permease [Mesorhizobium sp. AR10]|uniref:branched-chain amino acid ABC transporter permease n=1 Tax=Mesorhizobium sp. AR10 TaxID=2865839 RepID=UPI00215F0BD3|nr:branched-chain amino acid ABC transporter permease [Mesorhizobium sp. AR10]UVK37886.1 branched-chain amino acid ABC transporter permease [Mesorhizobium sp. AR10]
MQFFATQLLNGLTAGVVYAMLAVGYSLVYGILQQINFAHGYVYMFGTFVTASLITNGSPLWLAIAAGLAAGAVIAIVIERFAYRPVRGNRLAPTVTAVGVGLIIENVAQLIWTSRIRPMPFPFQADIIRLGPVVLSPLQILVAVVGLAMAALLWVISTKTDLGRAMRAVKDDLPTAELMGVPVDRVVVTVYVLGALFGVVGGILYGAYYNTLSVTMGFSGTLNAFTATVIGGIGSVWGAFAGGLLLGVLQAMVTGYVSSALLNTVTFTLLIAFLLFRPTGIAGVHVASRP